MEKTQIQKVDYRIDNTAKGCGECNFDRWENLVLCSKCLKKKEARHSSQA